MIDTRLPQEYKKGTIKDAKNFPVSNIIDLQNKQILTQDERRVAF